MSKIYKYIIISLSAIVFILIVNCIRLDIRLNASVDIVHSMTKSLKEDFDKSRKKYLDLFLNELEINRNRVQPYSDINEALVNKSDSVCRIIEHQKSIDGNAEENVANAMVDYRTFLKTCYIHRREQPMDYVFFNAFNFDSVHAYKADNTCLLDLLEMKVRGNENKASREFAGFIGHEDFRFDNLQAIVTTETSVVRVGDRYSANIFLGAYDSHLNPIITLNGQALEVNDGMANYKIKTKEPGMHTLSGSIDVTDRKKAVRKYPFSTCYYVMP